MSELQRDPSLDRALDDDEAALPALLQLLTIAAAADATMVCVGAGVQQITVLSAIPQGLAGRGLSLSPELIDTCGHGVLSTGTMLVPASVVGWLGFAPGAVCSVCISDERGSLSYLFFWFQQTPNPIPELDIIQRQGTLLLRSFAGRYSSALRLLRLQERLDTVLRNVSLGIVFIDFLAGSLLNPVAAEWLGIPADTRETAAVVTAMRQMKARCEVVSAADTEEIEPDRSTEYWVFSKRGLVLRVESHAMGAADSPGRFWVLTDVKPMWDSAQKLKSANKVLERNIGMLAEEMRLRMEAESELRRFNLGLKEQNAELEIGKLQSDLLAHQDPITGLANSRRFHKGLEELLDEVRGDGDRVALLFIDLDHFKQVNDTFGHERGDALLRQVGEILVKSLRRDDVIARLGGDEFTCAIKVKVEEGYADLVGTSQRLCEALKIPVEGEGPTVQVTASVGVAVYPDDAGDAASLMRAADKAMYLSKKDRGRGVVVFFGEDNEGFGPDSPAAAPIRKRFT